MTLQPGYPPAAPPPPSGPPPDPKARTLVLVSNVLGWGGIGILVVGGPLVGIALRSLLWGGVTAIAGLVLAVVGGAIGQVGRAMQGRVV